MVARPKGRDPEDLADWLEAELRETKAQLHKLESELEGSRKQVWSLETETRRLTESLAVSGSAMGQISVLREEMRQINDRVGRLQDRQAELANRTEEALRQRNSDSGRDKHDAGMLARQIESLGRNMDQYDARLHQAEESLRRAEEGVSGIRLAAQSLERGFEDAAGRSTRSLEAAARLEQDVARLTGDVDGLHKTDDALDDRISVVLEQVHRGAERLDKAEEIVGFPEEARELLHRATVERDQMVHRIALIEKLNGELTERMQQFGHAQGKLDQRQEVTTAQAMDLAGKIQEIAEQMDRQMKRLFQLILRQRRRQMDTLAQEIKELTQSDLEKSE